MAKKKKSADASAAPVGFVVIKDAKDNIYVAELGDPVTKTLTTSQKGALVSQFDAYRKSAEGRAASADALLVNSATGSFRILEQGSYMNSGDDGKKKKKS